MGGGNTTDLRGRTGRRPLLLALLAAGAGAGLASQRPAVAQTTCVRCTRYAITNLNQRKGPNLADEVLQVVPGGAAVIRESDAETNGYTLVTYLGVSGYVVALGLQAAPPPTSPNPGPTPVPTPAPPDVPGQPAGEARVTLVALNLRSGPSPDDPVVAVIPAGETVVLTREGAENGYVTVDWGGADGWVYADLIGEP